MDGFSKGNDHKVYICGCIAVTKYTEAFDFYTGTTAVLWHRFSQGFFLSSEHNFTHSYMYNRIIAK